MFAEAGDAFAGEVGKQLGHVIGGALGNLLGGGYNTPVLGGGNIGTQLRNARNARALERLNRPDGAIAALDQAHMANNLRALGLGDVDPRTALEYVGYLNAGTSAMNLGKATDLMGGLPGEVAAGMYTASRGMANGRGGWGWNQAEVEEFTRLVAGKAFAGPGGGVDFAYTRGMTMGEMGEIAAGMGQRGMFRFDPKRAESAVGQAERDLKDMIDVMDSLRGLTDSPTAPFPELMGMLDNMFGRNARLEGGTLKRIIADVNATVDVLGQDGKQVLAKLTDYGQRAQQAGLPGALGVDVGHQALLVEAAARDTAAMGAQTPGAYSNVSAGAVAGRYAQRVYSAANSNGGRNLTAVLRAYDMGLLSEGNTDQSRELWAALKSGDLDRLKDVALDLSRNGSFVATVGDMGLGAEEFNTIKEDTPGGLDQLNRPGMQEAMYDSQVLEGLGNVADQLYREDYFGDLRGNREQVYGFLRDAARSGAAMTPEGIQKMLDDRGIGGANAKQIYGMTQASFNRDSKGLFGDGGNDYNEAVITLSAREDRRRLDALREQRRRTMEALAEAGLTSSGGMAVVAQRVLGGFMDENADMSLPGAVARAAGGLTGDKLSALFGGRGNEEMLSALVGLQLGGKRYAAAGELDERIRLKFEDVEAARRGGGDVAPLERELARLREERKQYADLDTPEGQARIVQATEGLRILKEDYANLVDTTGTGADMEAYDAAAAAATTMDDRAAKLEKAWKHKEIGDEDFRRGMQALGGELNLAGDVVENNIGEEGRLVGHNKGVRELVQKLGTDDLGSLGETLRTAASNFTKLTGDYGPTRKRLSWQIAHDKITPEEARAELEKQGVKVDPNVDLLEFLGQGKGEKAGAAPGAVGGDAESDQARADKERAWAEERAATAAEIAASAEKTFQEGSAKFDEEMLPEISDYLKSQGLDVENPAVMAALKEGYVPDAAHRGTESKWDAKAFTLGRKEWDEHVEAEVGKLYESGGSADQDPKRLAERAADLRSRLELERRGAQAGLNGAAHVQLGVQSDKMIAELSAKDDAAEAARRAEMEKRAAQAREKYEAAGVTPQHMEEIHYRERGRLEDLAKEAAANPAVAEAPAAAAGTGETPGGARTINANVRFGNTNRGAERWEITVYA
jgi:hypothetical protein